MFPRISWVLAVCLAWQLASYAPGADEPPSAPGSEFAKLYKELKTSVAGLTQLKELYRTDPNADKQALEAEYDAKLAHAKEVSAKLAMAAERAYVASPNQDSTVNEYLYEHIRSLVGTDDFDPAVRLVKILDEHGFKHAFFDHFAGISYFGSHDFANAEAHLRSAVDNKESDDVGKRMLAASNGHTKLWEKEQAIRAAEDQADDLPKVKLTTSKGDIVLLLYENEAPNTVANFISLVEKKYYDGLKFHRVLPGFMAQGGDPKGDGSGGPGYTIPDEFNQQNHRNHFRGTLSMARTQDANSGGSQFFLTFLPTPHLDGQYTAFGRVIEGQNVLTKLQRCQPGDGGVADSIVSATVLRKRNHPYQPLTRPDKK